MISPNRRRCLRGVGVALFIAVMSVSVGVVACQRKSRLVEQFDNGPVGGPPGGSEGYMWVGKGDPVEPGAELTVQYVGMGQQSRAEFDSSWTRGEPATFPLDGVIQGWQEGILGMKPGGRRLLVIPGSMAYGPQGNPPAIMPDETLVFVVDLIEATPAS